MKKILYILTAIMIFTSCRSIDKMIESGNYDQALRFGVDKLRGEKNKKTKYVKGLEKAYAKLNKQDLEEIRNLKLTNSKRSLQSIVGIYERMNDRQKYVSPLLPLNSEDGYPAEFEMRDYPKLLNKSKVDVSELYYQTALANLNKSELQNNKSLARKAHSEFIESNRYFENYNDNYDLKRKAYELGQTHILIEQYVNGSNAVFHHTEEILNDIQLSNLNTTWKKYYTEDYGQPIDYIATIEVGEIMPGKESERYNSFTNTKEVVDGKKAKIKNGTVLKDTLGNTIYEKKKIVVTANIEELMREKISQMSGKIIIIDTKNNRHINTIPISVTHIFEDYSCRFRGDKRALTNEYNKRIKEYCAPFPTDYEMTTKLALEYKSVVEENIKSARLI